MAASSIVPAENAHSRIHRCGECRDHFETSNPEPGTCPCCTAQRIRPIIKEQNDLFRRVLAINPVWKGAMLQGQFVVSSGFRALPEDTQILLISAVATFNDFNDDNDPYGDHSFGVVEAAGARAFWKIDLYDTDYSFGVDLSAAADPSKVARVLTLYLPSEH